MLKYSNAHHKRDCYATISEVSKTLCTHRTSSRHYALTVWVTCFLFENFFPDCLCKVVRRRFGFAISRRRDCYTTLFKREYHERAIFKIMMEYDGRSDTSSMLERNEKKLK